MRTQQERRRRRDTDEAPDFNGALTVHHMARLFFTSAETIRRRVRLGTFPIPTLDGIDNRLRWAGPVVRRYLENNGHFTIASGGSDGR